MVPYSSHPGVRAATSSKYTKLKHSQSQDIQIEEEEEGLEGPFNKDITEEDFQECTKAAEKGIVSKPVLHQGEANGPVSEHSKQAR